VLIIEFIFLILIVRCEVNARHLYERKIKQIMAREREREKQNPNSSRKVDVKYNYNKGMSERERERKIVIELMKVAGSRRRSDSVSI
jgi:hypothetical protein